MTVSDTSSYAYVGVHRQGDDIYRLGFNADDPAALDVLKTFVQAVAQGQVDGATQYLCEKGYVVEEDGNVAVLYEVDREISQDDSIDRNRLVLLGEVVGMDAGACFRLGDRFFELAVVDRVQPRQTEALIIMLRDRDIVLNAWPVTLTLLEDTFP